MTHATWKTRFAPSLTGHLHLGHVAHLIYLLGLSAKNHIEILYRIEDHDQGRYRPEFRTSIDEDLNWLGVPQFSCPINFDSPSIQSSRFDTYLSIAKDLYDRGLVYSCTCSRKQIQDRTTGVSLEGAYDGHCRDRRLPFLTKDSGLRFACDTATVSFEDTTMGTIAQSTEAGQDDFLVRDRHGHWTYSFAVVIDDMSEGINWIIRGEDILPNTARQICLSQKLGRPKIPRYTHHPLIRDATGKKISKRDGDQTLKSRHAEDPQVTWGEAAYRVGLTKRLEPLSINGLEGLFPVVT